MWRRLKRHVRRTGRGRSVELLASACIGIILASACIRWINGALRPQMLALAETRIRNQITEIANAAVRDALALHQEWRLAEHYTGGRGEVMILSLDPLLLNELRLQVVEAVNGQISALEAGQLAIPLGSITGLDLLSGRGPGVPVHVLSAASVSADFRSELRSVGINQTVHRTLLDVEVTTRLLLPGCRTDVRVRTPVCISETVIVGGVPNYMMPFDAKTEK